jgi:2-polyprenyl-3-methyl-5-hydroxy-6-metoxy-1,4-benzoquinol methylase
MRIRIDPHQNEVRALKRVTDWRLKRVLEVGCGDGRLTLRLARLGALVHAIDPDEKLIRQARDSLPKRLASRIRYRVGKAEDLRLPDQSFDVVVFSWSL